MHTEPTPAGRFNTALIQRDMDARGWVATDLARASRGRLNDVRIHRFMSGEVQTPRTLALIARTLKQKPERYLLDEAVAS